MNPIALEQFIRWTLETDLAYLQDVGSIREIHISRTFMPDEKRFLTLKRLSS